jgi:hypothetical protein
MPRVRRSPRPELHQPSVSRAYCPECGYRVAPTDRVCPECGTLLDPEPVVVERTRAAKFRELAVVLVLFSAMVFVIVRSYAGAPAAKPTATPAEVANAGTPTPTPVPGQLTLDSEPAKVTRDTSATFTYSWVDPTRGSFQCRLDTQSFAPCDPGGHRYDQLSQGIHIFQIRVIRADGTPTDPVTYGWRVDSSAPVLSFFPDGGTYATQEQIVIQSADAGLIYYTTDGSDPTTASTKYENPILIRTATTLKAITVDDAGNISRIASATYAFAPSFHDDFELGTLDAWSSVENLTIDEQGGLNSARSARATSTGGTPAYAELDLAQLATDLYVQAAVMLRTQANNPVALMRFRSAAGDLLVTLYLSNTGRLGIQFGNNASTTGNVRLDPGRWNEIELHIRVADGRTTVEVWFNGSYLDDLYLTTTLAARPVETVQLGESADRRRFDISYDNFVLDRTFIPSAFMVLTNPPGAYKPIAIGTPAASPAASP